MGVGPVMIILLINYKKIACQLKHIFSVMKINTLNFPEMFNFSVTSTKFNLKEKGTFITN